MTTKRNVIKIRYCPRCGWLPRATWLAEELLTTFAKEIDELSLIPSEPGVFDVFVGTQMVWSREKEKVFLDIKLLKQRVRDLISPDKNLGHIDR